MGAPADDRIAEELAALRRLATLAAEGTAPQEVFTAVAAEAGQLLGVGLACVSRYEPDGATTCLARWNAAGQDRAADAGPRQDGPGVSAPIRVDGRLWGVLSVASVSEERLPTDTEARLAAFTELAATAIAGAQARMDLRGYAEEQAALRRVATLVARGKTPEDVYAAVAAEAGRLLGADLTGVARFEPGEMMTVLGAWGSAGTVMPFTVGTRTGLGGRNLSTLVFRTRGPIRIDDYSSATGAAADIGREWGYRAGVGVPIRVEGQLWGIMTAVSTREERLRADAETRLAGFAELAGTAIANAQARVDLRGYADEQTALRRVATLVAKGSAPEEVFAAVAEEIGRVLCADFTGMSRYDPDGMATAIGMWTSTDTPWPLAIGDRVELGGKNVSTLVSQTGQPARVEDYRSSSGAFAKAGRGWGFRSAVGVPIRVEDRLWGVVTVAYERMAVLPPDTEERLAGFTELVGTAIANAEAQAALAASRSRIVAAADEARRRIERDLHDGAQQRLVTLALRLREATATAPSGLEALISRLDDVVDGLDAALEELRETARGIHPAVLANGGLRPALRALARRSPVPVDLRVDVPGRLPGPIEIGAYYVVSEALTNTARHAGATAVYVEVALGETTLRISVRDDGRGGANPGGGSGLTGLQDRVEALGGRITLHSPSGAGTVLEIYIPVRAAGHAG
jgi:signal transduction histidine kinase